ncbi:phosphate ABC transporter substrate-binding protein PstS family protein [Haloparvum sp. PAK95]|uniref:phosphate ABC transporter substrate-binding protein PstS family protein n=1 Tax=Haloparvum sp. PAK95 TaxID=3418962 RepID=UPI003D2F2E51
MMAETDPTDASDSMNRRRFLTATGAAATVGLAGCTSTDQGEGTGTEAGLSGEVVITGSSTVFPVSDTMAELFMEEHADVNVTVDSTGTGGGFENHFCPGNSDINGASRPITDSEVENCTGNDVEPVEFEIAADALTVAVNNEADWVDCMTFDELRQIWMGDGAEKWSDVRDDWPDEQIELFGPASTSGTYDYFNEHVLGEDTQHTTDHEPTEEDNLIVQGIQDSKYAMGYFGYAYYSENQDLVKAVEIKKGDDGECTPPSLDNAKDGSYPLARPLFIYANEESLQDEAVYEFTKFYLEKAESDRVKEIGYVPSSSDQVEENLSTLEDAVEN